MDVVTLALAKKYCDEHGGGKFQPFPEISGTRVITAATLQELCIYIHNNFPDLSIGSVYAGAISGGCTPWGSGNAEMIVTVIASPVSEYDAVFILDVYSSNVFPYHWMFNSYMGEWGDWNWVGTAPAPANPNSTVGTYIVKYINGVPTWSSVTLNGTTLTIQDM